MQSTPGDGRTIRVADGDAPLTALELGRRIYARHGSFPAVGQLLSTLGFASRTSKFSSGLLPLRSHLERLWRRDNLSPKAWTAPIYALHFLDHRSPGVVPAPTRGRDTHSSFEVIKPSASPTNFAPSSRAHFDDPLNNANEPATRRSTPSEGRVELPGSLPGIAPKSDIFDHGLGGELLQNKSHLESTDRMAIGPQAEAGERTSESESGKNSQTSTVSGVIQGATETGAAKPSVTSSGGSDGLEARYLPAPTQREIAERSASLPGDSPQPIHSVDPGLSTLHLLQNSEAAGYAADSIGSGTPSPPVELAEGRVQPAATIARADSPESQSLAPVSVPGLTLGPAIVKRHLRLGRQNIKSDLIAPANASIRIRNSDGAVPAGENSVPSGSVRDSEGERVSSRSENRASRPFVKLGATPPEPRVADAKAPESSALQRIGPVSSVSVPGSETRRGKQRVSLTFPPGKGELGPPILQRLIATAGRSGGRGQPAAGEESSDKFTAKDRKVGPAQTIERHPSLPGSSAKMAKPASELRTLKEEPTPMALSGEALTPHSQQFVPPGSERVSKTGVFRHVVPSQASSAAKSASLSGALDLVTPLGQRQFSRNTGTLDAQRPPGNEEDKAAPEIGAKTGGVFGVASLTQPKSAVSWSAEAVFKTIQHPESPGNDSDSSVLGRTRTHLLQPTEEAQPANERVAADGLDAIGAGNRTESPRVPPKSIPKVLRPGLSGASESGSIGVQLVQRHLPDFTRGPIRHNFISGYGPLMSRATQRSFELLSRVRTQPAAPDAPTIRSERTSLTNNVVQSLEKKGATHSAGMDAGRHPTSCGSDVLKSQLELPAPMHLAQDPSQRTWLPSSDSTSVEAPMISVPGRIVRQGAMGYFPAIQRMTEVPSRRAVTPISLDTFGGVPYAAGYPTRRSQDETVQRSVRFSDSPPEPNRNEVFSRGGFPHKSVGLSLRALPTGFVPHIGRSARTPQEPGGLDGRLSNSPEGREGVSKQRATQQFVQRFAPAAVAAAGPQSGPPMTAPQVLPVPGQTTAGNTTKNLDVNRLADQVYQLIVRRMASERERRGL